MRSFKVDEVVAVESMLPLAALKLNSLLDAKVVAKSQSLERCVAAVNLEASGGMNALLHTVHLAFAQHRPLTLSPDDVWLAILQGFALHARENAESLRERFVDFAGRTTLTVEIEDPANWPANLLGFEHALAGARSPGFMKAATGTFSTTSSDTHLAFCIAAMDSFSRYFDYEMMCVCGIPRVTLTGTVEDWRTLHARFEVLAEYDLQWWSQELRPVLDQFIRTAAGHVDTDFWQSIYKPKKAYGGETITGWILRLFPYLGDEGVFSRNEFERRGWVHEPISPSQIPRGLSAAQARMRGAGETTLFSLNSGFFGVQQLKDASLSPLIGWTVSESSLERLFDAIARAHPLDPPVSGRSWAAGPTHTPALLRAFGARFGGGPLYEGELVLHPPPQPVGEDEPHASQFVQLERPDGQDSLFALHLASLRDGRRLLWVSVERGEAVVLAGGSPPFQLVAHSLLEFLQRLSTETSFPPWELKGTWSPQLA